jgi:hypothetical protein
MKRFLTSRSSGDKADAADLVSERTVHPWRNLELPSSRSPVLAGLSNPGLARRSLSLVDVSVRAPPGSVYARAAQAAAASAGVTGSPGIANFQPITTSTPNLMPPPPRGPVTRPALNRPVPSFIPPSTAALAQRLPHQSTAASAATWHARAAAARENRRPAITNQGRKTPPSAELVALAERFRGAAAANQADQIRQHIAQDSSQQAVNTSAWVVPPPKGLDSSMNDIFYSAILQNKSILDSDVRRQSRYSH